MTGQQAYAKKRLAIAGDFNKAQEVETLFLRAGGPTKAVSIIKRIPALKSKL